MKFKGQGRVGEEERVAAVVFITRRSRRLHNAKHERERRAMVQVDLWVATVKGTGRKGGWKRRGGKRGPVEERETVFVSQVSRAVHGHGDRLARRPD